MKITITIKEAAKLIGRALNIQENLTVEITEEPTQEDLEKPYKDAVELAYRRRHGDGKIAAFKEVRSITGLGLKEAEDMVDKCWPGTRDVS